jgi:transcription elongation factor Elf1
MRILKKRTMSRALTCPTCEGNDLGLGYVDRVTCTVLHGCNTCGDRWRDHLVDLADSQLAQRVHD